VSERFSRVPTWVARLRLPLTTVLVLIALGCYANRGGKCFPSMESIADRVGIPRKKVPAHIRRLVERGLISVTPPSPGRRSNRYVIHYQDPLDDSTERPESSPGDSMSPGEDRAVALNVPPSGDRTAQESNQPSEQTDVAGKSADWTGGQNPKSVVQEALFSWNRVAKDCGLQVVDYPSVRLCIELQKCLAACGGLTAWDSALERVRASQFLQGRTKKASWQVTLGWLVKPGNFAKVIGDKYTSHERSCRSSSLAEIVNHQVAKMAGRRSDE
jgi:hypothetical protein